MVEVPDVAGLGARVEALEAETDRLRIELSETKQEIASLREERRTAPRRPQRGAECYFLTLAAAATALGLGRERLRALIQLGALRTVSFPNGRLRVPRSELARIDELGLEVVFSVPPVPRRQGQDVDVGPASTAVEEPAAEVEERLPAIALARG